MFRDISVNVLSIIENEYIGFLQRRLCQICASPIPVYVYCFFFFLFFIEFVMHILMKSTDTDTKYNSYSKISHMHSPLEEFLPKYLSLLHFFLSTCNPLPFLICPNIHSLLHPFSLSTQTSLPYHGRLIIFSAFPRQRSPDFFHCI